MASARAPAVQGVGAEERLTAVANSGQLNVPGNLRSGGPPDRSGQHIVMQTGSGMASLVLMPDESAEQLFASRCELLISVTSSGQVKATRPPPYFVLIEHAPRDEGASYHYLPPAEFSDADAGLLAKVEGAYERVRVPVDRGAAWTTDAPYRETQAAIDHTTARGLLAVGGHCQLGSNRQSRRKRSPLCSRSGCAFDAASAQR